MAIQMQLWTIEGDRPVRLASAKLELEARLERWICHDLGLIGEDLLLLGNQVTTTYGHSVDVLALDSDGNLVIIELKRGRTPRDIVAQILDYASWAHGLSGQEIKRFAEDHRDQPLDELFFKQFRTVLPESLNEDQRLLIIASELDPQSERIVQFLSGEHGVNINVVFFDYFRHGEQEFVGRSWLIPPEQVKRNVTTLGPPGRRRLLTLEELAGLAVDRGVGAVYRALFDGLEPVCDQVGTTQSNVSYRWRTATGSRALVSAYPKASNAELGLVTDIRIDDLASQFHLTSDALRAALPQKLERKEIGLYLYAEGYAFRNREEVNQFLAKIPGSVISSHRAGGT